MSFDVFISYSKHDRQQAHAVCEALEAKQVQCWIAPRNITPGMSWGAGIINGISNSKLMLLIFSRHSNISPQVHRELERAVSKGLLILPFRLEDVRPDANIEYFISSQQWLDAFGSPFQEQLATLVKHVQSLLNQIESQSGCTVDSAANVESNTALRDSTLKSLTAAVSLSSSGQQASPNLEATIDHHLIELAQDAKLRPWPLKRPYYTVGREGAKITLPDRRVSRRHIVIAQLGPDWVALQDVRTEKPMTVNGRSLIQRTLCAGDVLRIGQTSLVFVPGAECLTPSPRTPLASGLNLSTIDSADKPPFARSDPHATLEDEDEDGLGAYVCLSKAGQMIGSFDQEHILIGSAQNCAVQLQSAGVMPYHCMLVWSESGLMVVDLGGGVTLDLRPVRSALISSEQTLGIADQQIRVDIKGDPCRPAISLKESTTQLPRSVNFSAFYGPHAGQYSVLPIDRPLVLGSGDECDIGLSRDQTVPKRAVELLLPYASTSERRPFIELRRLDNAVDVLVDGKAMGDRGRIYLGSALQFRSNGRVLPSAFLSHFDLASTSW
jgi:pSer/pThr/pTyr-binding forkhead associated (FHA) protein